MKKNLNIAYLNGAEGMIRRGGTSNGGYCIPIVDSEDKLESLGLKQGQIAAVAVDTMEIKSFSELYQPIQTLPNSKPLDFDNWDKVTGITCEIPYGLNSEEQGMLVIVPRTFYEDYTCMYMLYVAYNDEVPSISLIEQFSGTSIDIITVLNGEPKINQSAVNDFNEILSNGDFVYAGSFESNFSIIDLGVKVKKGNRIANLYINNGGLFDKMTTQQELERKIHSVTMLSKAGYKSMIKIEYNLPSSDGQAFNLKSPYTIINIQGGRSLGIKKIQNSNENEVNEYIIEYHCYGLNLDFAPELNIVWENDTPPAFEPNTIVRISIINGLATYKVFPMST